MSEPIHIISLGAGVQSSTMALMAAAGEINPSPACCVFADTQSEPASVYRWLEFLEDKLPFPVYRVTRGSLEDGSTTLRKSKKSGKIYMKGSIPAFVKKPSGGIGLLGRQCTADYKIAVLTRKARSLCDWKRGESRGLVTLWMGISFDEIWRMKPSREKWIAHRWPLIEQKMTRDDCLSWMKRRGFPEPPRSACVFCPFHSDAEWIRLRDKEPLEFGKAVKYEARLQKAASMQEVLEGKPFLHRDCVPLDKVVFDNSPSHVQLNMFNNDCSGMCGV